MRHYIYRIDNGFNICKVKATNVIEAKRLIKEATGVPMKDQKVISRVIAGEYWIIPHIEFIGKE